MGHRGLSFNWQKFRAGSFRKESAISHIIIDGYNLIGIAHADLAAERERLILALSAYRKKKGHDITVVFDGWKSGGRYAESRTTGGIRVIYTRLGDTADSQIKEIVAREKREWIVVTSDRDIASFVWGAGSVPVASDDFRHALERAEGLSAYRGGRTGEDASEEGPGKRKGRARTPSRREKALVRVLKKL